MYEPLSEPSYHRITPSYPPLFRGGGKECFQRLYLPKSSLRHRLDDSTWFIALLSKCEGRSTPIGTRERCIIFLPNVCQFASYRGTALGITSKGAQQYVFSNIEWTNVLTMIRSSRTVSTIHPAA